MRASTAGPPPEGEGTPQSLTPAPRRARARRRRLEPKGFRRLRRIPRPSPPCEGQSDHGPPGLLELPYRALEAFPPSVLVALPDLPLRAPVTRPARVRMLSLAMV